jgi:hypothetical protein
MSTASGAPAQAGAPGGGGAHDAPPFAFAVCAGDSPAAVLNWQTDETTPRATAARTRPKSRTVGITAKVVGIGSRVPLPLSADVPFEDFLDARI